MKNHRINNIFLVYAVVNCVDRCQRWVQLCIKFAKIGKNISNSSKTCTHI